MNDNNVKGSADTSTVGIETGDVVVEKTYTESEVQALLQREGDRRVSSALNKPWWQSITTGGMLCFFILLQSIVLWVRAKLRAKKKK